MKLMNLHKGNAAVMLIAAAGWASLLPWSPERFFAPQALIAASSSSRETTMNQFVFFIRLSSDSVSNTVFTWFVSWRSGL